MRLVSQDMTLSKEFQIYNFAKAFWRTTGRFLSRTAAYWYNTNTEQGIVVEERASKNKE